MSGWVVPLCKRDECDIYFGNTLKHDNKQTGYKGG